MGQFLLEKVHLWQVGKGFLKKLEYVFSTLILYLFSAWGLTAGSQVR